MSSSTVLSTPNIHLSIVVYKGSPLDYSHYRHTALWIRYPDSSPAVLVHVVGPRGDFLFESRESESPWETKRFAKVVEVGYLTRSAASTEIMRALRAIPIRNHDREFDCQVWVESALKAFKDSGYLTEALYTSGVDGMIDAIAEAEDIEE